MYCRIYRAGKGVKVCNNVFSVYVSDILDIKVLIQDQPIETIENGWVEVYNSLTDNKIQSYDTNDM